MAARYLTTKDVNLTTAVGGTINAGDDVNLLKWGEVYTNADLSSDDLNSLVLGPGFVSELKAQGADDLKAVVNNGGAGYYKDVAGSPYIELVSTGPTGVIVEIRCGPTGAGRRLFNEMDTERVYFFAATVATVGANCDWAAAEVGGGADVTFVSSSYQLATLWVGPDSTARVARDIGTANICGGTLLSTDSTNAPTAINLYSGTWKVLETGNLGTLTGKFGLVDFYDLKTPITVTARVCGPNVTIRYKKSTRSLVTWTSTAGDLGGGPIEIEED